MGTEVGHDGGRGKGGTTCGSRPRVLEAPSVAFFRVRMSFSQRLRWTAKSPASLIIASLRALAVAGKLRSSVMCHFCLACRWATVETEVTALR